jgi:hypothetical protein
MSDPIKNIVDIEKERSQFPIDDLRDEGAHAVLVVV